MTFLLKEGMSDDQFYPNQNLSESRVSFTSASFGLHDNTTFSGVGSPNRLSPDSFHIAEIYGSLSTDEMSHNVGNISELPPQQYISHPSQINLAELELAHDWDNLPGYATPYTPSYVVPTMAAHEELTLSYSSLPTRLTLPPHHSSGPHGNECSTATPWSLSPQLTSAAPSTITDEEYEEEAPFDDKPYARLIHQALMQAPGHRMMLREIYDWFRKNTSKAREPGSKGWQNSIRHNLSMNKAFENDRSEVTSAGGPRKANSIWVLTEDAIRHGVQSTTRYRKSGSGRRVWSARIPATKRQKSGAKGGRAARRAAQLRRQEAHPHANYGGVVPPPPFNLAVATPQHSPTTPTWSPSSDHLCFTIDDQPQKFMRFPKPPLETESSVVEEFGQHVDFSAEYPPSHDIGRFDTAEEESYLHGILLQSMQDPSLD